MNFSVSYKPDQRSFINANLALLRSRLAFRIVAVVVLIMTIASIVSFFVFTKSHAKNLSPIFLLIYVAIIGAVMYIRLRKRYAQNTALSEEKTYTFTDRGIHINGTSFNADTDWVNVTKVYTTRRFLFLFLNKANALYIAKDKFTPSQLSAIDAKVNNRS